ncbi:MAG: hypothetical protein ACSHXH_12305 [Marivita sp.]|uniref:hypothetical protein n=1 Tax=Marivita sp. TaxID=2003365 RepID=UPI003EF7A7E2
MSFTLDRSGVLDRFARDNVNVFYIYLIYNLNSYAWHGVVSVRQAGSNGKTCRRVPVVAEIKSKCSNPGSRNARLSQGAHGADFDVLAGGTEWGASPLQAFAF